MVEFHIGSFCFHFDAVLVRRVSLWRGSTSARFCLARFHFGAFLFGAFPNFVRTYDDPVSANASFARTIIIIIVVFSIATTHVYAYLDALHNKIYRYTIADST